MKIKICMLVLVPFLCFSTVRADNNIMIMVDTIWSDTYDIPVGFENDVPLLAVSNGLRISATGDLTAYFIRGAGYFDPVSRGGAVPGSIGWLITYYGADPVDTVLTGGAYL
jgi:hypothetical protein